MLKIFAVCIPCWNDDAWSYEYNNEFYYIYEQEAIKHVEYYNSMPVANIYLENKMYEFINKRQTYKFSEDLTDVLVKPKFDQERSTDKEYLIEHTKLKKEYNKLRKEELKQRQEFASNEFEKLKKEFLAQWDDEALKKVTRPSYNKAFVKIIEVKDKFVDN